MQKHAFSNKPCIVQTFFISHLPSHRPPSSIKLQCQSSKFTISPRIYGIASYLFDIDSREKLVKVNCIIDGATDRAVKDGATDRAVKEQQVLYVMYVDTETHKPN